MNIMIELCIGVMMLNDLFKNNSNNADIIYIGRVGFCEYIPHKLYKIIKFSNVISMKDWEFISDEYYSFFKTIEKAHVVDFTNVSDYDEALYAIIVWMRIRQSMDNVKFLFIVNKLVNSRLRRINIHKWFHIIQKNNCQ